MPRPTRWTWMSVVCAAFVHLLYLATPLHVDEAGVSMVGRSLLAGRGSSLYGTLWIDRPPPLVLLFGYADAAAGAVGVRLIGLVAAVAMVLACAWTTRRLVGIRYEPFAAVLAAMLASAPALSAHVTYAELIGAPFVCASVGCIAPIIARERARTRSVSADNHGSSSRPPHPGIWVLAGVFAACALLFKQSFIDGIVTGFALALASRGVRTIAVRVALFTLGVATPIGLTLAWAATRTHGIAQLAYAVFGFRVDAAHALATAHVPLIHRLTMLLAGITAAGYVMLFPVVIYGLRSAARISRAYAGCLAVWLAAGWFGVLGGGYFWTHYMIGVAPVMIVLSMHGVSGVVQTRTDIGSRRFRAPIVVVAACALISGVSTLVSARQAGPSSQRAVLSVADVVEDNRQPGDSIYVVYARANVAYYAHAIPAFPYQWSLMYRTFPSIERRVLSMLRGGNAPDWIVEWNSTQSFGMDADGHIRAALASRYREVATPCGIPVLLRRDDRRPLRPDHTPVCS